MTIRPAALIPSFEDGPTVVELAVGALRHLDTVLVVDDGSTDGTRERLAGLGGRVRVVAQPRNLGKGRALREGFRLLAAEGFTHAVTLDADGQHLSEEIPVLLRAAAGAPDALVVGRRDLRREGAPAGSRLGLRLSNAALRWLFGLRIEDSQCGFRAYPLARIAPLGLRGRRYDLELEALVLCARAGIPIIEVPVRAIYSSRPARKSHFRPVRDSLLIAGRAARALTGTPCRPE